MDQPVKIHRYIALIVDKELENNIIKCWYDCVEKNAPSGVVATIQMIDDNGSYKSVKLVHRTTSREMYIIPLSRDLLSDEVEKIVGAFVEKNPELDFDIETNVRFSVQCDKELLTKNHDDYLSLANALSKKKHEDWMKDKLDNEWRYGEFNLEDKTHPLLLPWEQLPNGYREVDLELPIKLFDIFNDQGYKIVPVNELEKILKK